MPQRTGVIFAEHPAVFMQYLLYGIDNDRDFGRIFWGGLKTLFLLPELSVDVCKKLYKPYATIYADTIARFEILFNPISDLKGGNLIMNVLGALLLFFGIIALIVGVVLVLFKKRKIGRNVLYGGGGGVVLGIILVAVSGGSSATTPSTNVAAPVPSKKAQTKSLPSQHKTTTKSTITKPKDKTVATTSSHVTTNPSQQPATSTPQQIFVQEFSSLASSGAITVEKATVQFVGQHGSWFPAANGDTSYVNDIDHTLTLPMILKQPALYTQNLYANSGTVMVIHQFANPTYAQVQIATPNGNQAVVMYEGDTGSIVQGSTVNFVGLPVSQWYFPNLGGGTTDSILFDGVSLTLATNPS